jgi:hypothetical protein
VKLNYIAHGEAVNMAARLKAANKMLGASILVGPSADSASVGHGSNRSVPSPWLDEQSLFPSSRREPDRLFSGAVAR